MEREILSLLHQLRPWSTFGNYSGGMIRGKASNFSTPWLLTTRQILSCKGEISSRKLNRYLFARNQDSDLIYKPGSVQETADSWKTLPEGGVLPRLEKMNGSRRFFCLRDYIYKPTMARPYINVGLWPSICSNQSRKLTYCLQWPALEVSYLEARFVESVIPIFLESSPGSQTITLLTTGLKLPGFNQ